MLHGRLGRRRRAEVVRPDEPRRAHPVGRGGHREPGPGGGRRLTQPTRAAVVAAFAQPGQAHARREPVQVAGQPVQRREPPGGRRRPAQPPGGRDGDEEHHDGEHARGVPTGPDRPAGPAEPEHGQQGERDVERDLRTQAPRVREPRQQRPLVVDGGERPGPDPVRGGARGGTRHQQGEAGHGEQVRREEAHGAPPQVRGRPHHRGQTARGEHPRPHEEEAGQDEEDRDTRVPAGEPAGPGPPGAGPALEAHVGQQDEGSGRRPVHLEDGQVVPGPGGRPPGRGSEGERCRRVDLRCRTDGGGRGHRARTTSAATTQIPASGVAGRTRTAAAVRTCVPTGSSTVCGPS